MCTSKSYIIITFIANWYTINPNRTQMQNGNRRNQTLFFKSPEKDTHKVQSFTTEKPPSHSHNGNSKDNFTTPTAHS